MSIDRLGDWIPTGATNGPADLPLKDQQLIYQLMNDSIQFLKLMLGIEILSEFTLSHRNARVEWW